jgi:hypothetical protein
LPSARRQIYVEPDAAGGLKKRTQGRTHHGWITAKVDSDFSAAKACCRQRFNVLLIRARADFRPGVGGGLTQMRIGTLPKIADVCAQTR